MPIEKKDGFFRSQDLSDYPSIGIESICLDSCIEEIKKKKIKAVFGAPCFGFKEDNLSFLLTTPWIKSIWFWDVTLNDIEGLYSLTKLQSFGCHPKRPPIDFSKFKHLKKIIIEPKSKDIGLDSLKSLKLLHIWHYKPKNKDFSSLSIPKSVNELQINWANPSSLDSLPELPNLKRLEIHRCRNLVDLGDLNTKYPKLNHLIINTCGKVPESESIRIINSLKKLKHASIQGYIFP